MTESQIKTEVIKILPDNWPYAKKLKVLEQLAEIYRKKSREEVEKDSLKFRAKVGRKDIDYSPVLHNGKG